MALYDPRGRRNRAVLFGVTSYRYLEDLPGVRDNLDELHRVLTAGAAGVFQPGQVARVSPDNRHAFITALDAAVSAAPHLLLVYFAGHGRVHKDGSRLTLMVGDSRQNVDEGAEVLDGVSWSEDVLPRLRTARADRIAVILDCCYSGNAAQEFEPGQKAMYLLTSVQANREIPAGDGTGCTPFTARLVELLRDGLPIEGRPGAREPVAFEPLGPALVGALKGQATISGDAWLPQVRKANPPDDVVLSYAPRESAARRIPLPVRLRFAWLRFTLRLRRPSLRLAAVVVAVALLGSAIGLSMAAALSRPAAACPTPLELRLLTDPDAQPVITSAVQAYLTSPDNRQPLEGNPASSRGCRQTDVTVYSAPSGSVVQAFQQADAWSTFPGECPAGSAAPSPAPGTGKSACFEPARDVGPQPDIWVPAATADVDEVANPSGTAAFGADIPLAFLPLVVGVPDALTGKLAAVGIPRTGARLADIVSAVQGGSGTVDRPDPASDTAALLSTVGLYTDGATGNRISQARLTGLERDLASQGTSQQSDTALMCRLADPDATDPSAQRSSAVLVAEQTLAAFDQATGSTPSCAGAVPQHRTAYYPGDVPPLDHPFVSVTWGSPRDKNARADAVNRLHDWLQGPEGQGYFVRAGYRGADRNGVALPPGADSPLARDHAVDAGFPPPAHRDAPDELAGALTSYRSARGPGEVLFILDTSASMSARWPTAIAALQQSLAALGPDDTYGIWTTPSAPDGRSARGELVPLGGTGQSDASVRARVAALKPTGGDADLATVLRDAIDTMRPRSSSDTTPRLVVVITDDSAETLIPAATSSGLVGDARTTPRVPLTMVSLLGGGCDGNTLDTQLADASRGVCLDLSDDPLRALPDQVAKTGTGNPS